MKEEKAGWHRCGSGPGRGLTFSGGEKSPRNWHCSPREVKSPPEGKIWGPGVGEGLVEPGRELGGVRLSSEMLFLTKR